MAVLHGIGNWGRLPSQRSHRIRVRINSSERTLNDRRILCSGVGNTQYVAKTLPLFLNLNYIPAGPLVALIVVASFRNTSQDDNFLCSDIDAMWRLIIGLGCVPGAIALYFRLTMTETPRFTINIDGNVEKARQDIHNASHPRSAADHSDVGPIRVRAPSFGLKDFISYFSQRENMKILFATAYSWFALDVRIRSYKTIVTKN